MRKPTPRESNAFTRLSILFGPKAKVKPCGGAAGNRTRVQFAYYTHVYPHSQEDLTIRDIG